MATKHNGKSECSFSWRRELDWEYNLEFFVLRYQSCAQPPDEIEAWIAPGVGSNLCRLQFNGHRIIDFRPELLRPDFTGTPVLYPTPNRVRNGVFRYQGKNYPQILRGATILEHGLVHGEMWSCDEPEITDRTVVLKTWLDFAPFNPLFAVFPFHHRLNVEFHLFDDGIQIGYTLVNQDERAIPFGFGLHPYFMRLGGDQHTLVELPATQVMDAGADLIPTGRLIPVNGTRFDLTQPVAIGDLDLDHVFTGLIPGRCARVFYPDLGLSVVLQATSDFTHQVLYSPRGMDFFCLENQTCSTDAHNLYDQGFIQESGLKFVGPGETHTGSVTYRIAQEK